MKPALRSLLLVVVALLCGVVAVRGEARAADAPKPRAEEEQARQAFARGEQLFRSQKYVEAAAAFEEGNKLSPSSAFLFDLALTYRALNNPQQAISYYQAYLKAEPKAADRAAVESAIAEEQKKLAKAPAPPSPATQKVAAKEPPKETTKEAPKDVTKEAAKEQAKEPSKDAATQPAVAAATSKDGDLTTQSKSDRPAEQPVWRKWWFWTATGAVVVGAVAIGLGVGLSNPGTEPYREVTWR